MTIYWILWVIGWIFVVATLKFIPWWDGRDALAGKPLKTRITIIVLICISIMMVGGIINGIFLGPLLGSNSELKSMNLQEIINLAANTVAIPAFLTYAVGFAVLGLQRIKNVFLHIIFLMIFVVSIAFWTIPITKYNQNIVVEKSTSIANTVEHDLYYFCNIPVQKLSI